MYEGCLVVVDMVNGFVREGVLHDEEIASIIPRQIELIKDAKNEILSLETSDYYKGPKQDFDQNRPGDIWEFKKNNIRVYVVKTLKEVYIVMGGYKADQKRDIERVKRRVKQFTR